RGGKPPFNGHVGGGALHMQEAFWPKKIASPRLLRADLGRAGSPRVQQSRGPPVQVEWQFLFGICTKKPALRARDRWWLLLRLALRITAGGVFPPAPPSRKIATFSLFCHPQRISNLIFPPPHPPDTIHTIHQILTVA